MRSTATLMTLVVAFLLTGCTASGIAEFDREQVASDKLDLPARYFEDNRFDADSTRWLADHDGFGFYAAQFTDGTCLILVRDGDVNGSLAGCGNRDVGISGDGFPTVHLYLDSPPQAAIEGAIELTPNLYVMERVQG